jgi:hypothetical protein
LLNCAAHEPAAIIVDLDAMSSDTVSLTVFSAVSLRINDWPGIPLVLASTRQPMRAALDASTMSRVVPTCPSVAQALESLHPPAPRRRRQVVLATGPASARQARRVVQETCDEWEITHITVDATQVASELTENAIVHAGSARWLRLELRDHTFTIAVADIESGKPRVGPAPGRYGGGRGLVLVAALSRAWGSAPHPDGGKVVWSALTVTGRLPSAEGPPRGPSL